MFTPDTEAAEVQIECTMPDLLLQISRIPASDEPDMQLIWSIVQYRVQSVGNLKLVPDPNAQGVSYFHLPPSRCAVHGRRWYCHVWVCANHRRRRHLFWEALQTYATKKMLRTKTCSHIRN